MGFTVWLMLYISVARADHILAKIHQWQLHFQFVWNLFKGYKRILCWLSMIDINAQEVYKHVTLSPQNQTWTLIVVLHTFIEKWHSRPCMGLVCFAIWCVSGFVLMVYYGSLIAFHWADYLMVIPEHFQWKCGVHICTPLSYNVAICDGHLRKLDDYTYKHIQNARTSLAKKCLLLVILLD